MKIKIKRPQFFKIVSIVVMLSMLTFFAYQQNVAKAAALTILSDTMSNLNAAGLSNHDIKFRSPTGMSAGTITMDIGTAGFTKGTVDYTDIDLQYGSNLSDVNGTCGGSCTKATLDSAAGDGKWVAALDGSSNLTLTYPISGGTAIAASDYIRVLIGTNATTGVNGDQQMTNPAIGTKVFTVNVAGTTDSGKLAVVIITNDQIPVTANVDPTLTFTVATTTLDLGTITPSAVKQSTSDNNITIGTNAPSGYAVTVKDAGNGSNPGLYNTNASKLIPSATTTPLTLGTEGYGGQCNKVSGSGSCTFTAIGTDNITGFTLAGGTFASYASKPSGTDTFQIRLKAAVSSSTESGAYTDTLTLIATANY